MQTQTRYEMRKKQLEAERLYLEGMAKDRIAEIIKVSDRTLDRWEIGLDWKEKRKIVDKRVSDNLQDNVVEMKTRHLKIIRGTLGRYAEKLNKNEVKVTSAEAVKMLEYEKELLEPKQHTFNLIKQENTQINLGNEAVSRIRERIWKLQNQQSPI